ncbi:MAG: ATP-binding protein [Ignavibacteriae bacterium HGW-Ignavibacteriae-2]|jgi:Mrp family chromosome partitioning ATPase|nr:MAG: ATP-binding protein [Ignavibacteriae bacterium HGW-Ignavibacteriae-2]
MNEEEKQKSFDEEEKRIKENISKISHRIAVFSGKGGVGKTTVSVNLAYGLQMDGLSTGLLDADITGPNVAKMLGINNELIVVDSKMIPFEKFGVKMISIASLIESGQPVIWRGPMRSKIISQFLADVEWGELDYLIADLPPGTGDEILTIAQQMKPDYAVVVTTPQEVSVIDAERAINMAKKLEIPFIGVVENMSGFVCPHCSAVIELFGSGGGKKLADDYEVPFLGSIPIDIDARIMGDMGKPIVLEKPESEVSTAFKSILDIMDKHYHNEFQSN